MANNSGSVLPLFRFLINVILHSLRMHESFADVTYSPLVYKIKEEEKWTPLARAVTITSDAPFCIFQYDVQRLLQI
jgi:hypothetical protein